VVGAGDDLAAVVFARQPAGRERRSPVRADVLDGVGLAGLGSAEQDRLAEDLVALQLAGLQVAGQGREIPDVRQIPLAEVRVGRESPSGMAGF
jgi:hypothetical protein